MLVLQLIYIQSSVALGCYVAVLSLGRLVTMGKLVVMDTIILYLSSQSALSLEQFRSKLNICKVSVFLATLIILESSIL